MLTGIVPSMTKGSLSTYFTGDHVIIEIEETNNEMKGSLQQKSERCSGDVNSLSMVAPTL